MSGRAGVRLRAGRGTNTAPEAAANARKSPNPITAAAASPPVSSVPLRTTAQGAAANQHDSPNPITATATSKPVSSVPLPRSLFSANSSSNSARMSRNQPFFHPPVSFPAAQNKCAPGPDAAAYAVRDEIVSASHTQTEPPAIAGPSRVLASQGPSVRSRHGKAAAPAAAEAGARDESARVPTKALLSPSDILLAASASSSASTVPPTSHAAIKQCIKCKIQGEPGGEERQVHAMHRVFFGLCMI